MNLVHDKYINLMFYTISYYLYFYNSQLKVLNTMVIFSSYVFVIHLVVYFI